MRSFAYGAPPRVAVDPVDCRLVSLALWPFSTTPDSAGNLATVAPLTHKNHWKNVMTKRTYAGRLLGVALGLVVVALGTNAALASDWNRFRGPDGSGISPDTRPLPLKWSETENLKWKCKLPGPGSSSPIVVGQRLFVTCWTGYGADRDNVGDPKDLRRHLICLDRDTGKVLWDKSIDPVLPEDPYSGNFTQHGYASHTPVSDGERVYVFFGKTGVLAFDLEGKQLWQTSVGTGSGPNGWGTASSPILYKNLVIVTAAAESKALVALNKETGKEVWRFQDPGVSSIWGYARARGLWEGTDGPCARRAAKDLGARSK